MALSKITNSGVATSGLPAGSIVQVIEGTYATQISTALTTFQTTYLSASITPNSTSNKILISASISAYAETGRFLDLTVYRGATNLGGGGENAMSSHYAGGGNTWFHLPVMHLDSPNTTSATTYTVYYKPSAGTGYAHVNRIDGGKIYLMEIAQ